MAPQEMGDIAVTEIAEEPEQAARSQRAKTVTDHVPEGGAPGSRRPEQQRSDDRHGVRRPELHKTGDDRDTDLEGDQDRGIDRGGLRHENNESRVAPDSHKVQDRASQGTAGQVHASGVGRPKTLHRSGQKGQTDLARRAAHFNLQLLERLSKFHSADPPTFVGGTPYFWMVVVRLALP